MDEKQTVLQCDISLELKGSDVVLLNHQTANILRKLADQVERDEFDYRHHQLVTAEGEFAGSLYMDFAGERARDPACLEAYDEGKPVDTDEASRDDNYSPRWKEKLVSP